MEEDTRIGMINLLKVVTEELDNAEAAVEHCGDLGNSVMVIAYISKAQGVVSKVHRDLIESRDPTLSDLPF